MRISSANTDSWIDIKYNGENSFTVQVHIDIGHGRFDATNVDVNWLHYRQFVSEFDNFILDRSLTPRLEGTYNTFLAFSGHAHRIMLEYRLGDGYYGDTPPEEHYQSGTFEMNQESLLQILAEFRRHDSRWP